MTSIALHPRDPNPVFAAGAAGGVWKTPDLGGSWFPRGASGRMKNAGQIFDPPYDYELAVADDELLERIAVSAGASPD